MLSLEYLVCSSLAAAMGNADAVISAIGGSGDKSNYKAVDNEVSPTNCIALQCLSALLQSSSTASKSLLFWPFSQHKIMDRPFWLSICSVACAGECSSCGRSAQEEDQQVCTDELSADQWQGGWPVSQPRQVPLHGLSALLARDSCPHTFLEGGAMKCSRQILTV